jgi:hypothetical protein
MWECENVRMNESNDSNHWMKVKRREIKYLQLGVSRVALVDREWGKYSNFPWVFRVALPFRDDCIATPYRAKEIPNHITLSHSHSLSFSPSLFVVSQIKTEKENKGNNKRREKNRGGWTRGRGRRGRREERDKTVERGEECVQEYRTLL